MRSVRAQAKMIHDEGEETIPRDSESLCYGSADLGRVPRITVRPRRAANAALTSPDPRAVEKRLNERHLNRNQFLVPPRLLSHFRTSNYVQLELSPGYKPRPGERPG